MDTVDRNQRLIEDFTERTLAAISTEYGRLLYLASLRDIGTGAYSHSGLEAIYPSGAVKETLTVSHRLIFERILQAPLERQYADLRACLAGYDEDLGALAARWAEVEFYRSLMPLGLSESYKELFCTNLPALLGAIESDEATAAKTA